MVNRILPDFLSSFLSFLFVVRGRRGVRHIVKRRLCSRSSRDHKSSNRAASWAPLAPHTPMYQTARLPSDWAPWISISQSLLIWESHGQCCRTSSRFQAWGRGRGCRSCADTQLPSQSSRRFLWPDSQASKKIWTRCSQIDLYLACIPKQCNSSQSSLNTRWTWRYWDASIYVISPLQPSPIKFLWVWSLSYESP